MNAEHVGKDFVPYTGNCEALETVSVRHWGQSIRHRTREIHVEWQDQSLRRRFGRTMDCCWPCQSNSVSNVQSKRKGGCGWRSWVKTCPFLRLIVGAHRKDLSFWAFKLGESWKQREVECIHVKIKRLKLKFRHFVVVTSPFRKSQIS